MFIKKRWVTILGCLAALALFAPALASPEPPQETPEEAALHEGLRQLKTVFEEAANNNDIEKLRPYIAPEFSVVTFTDSSFNDFDSFKKKWEESRETLLDGGTYKVELQPDRSILLGNNMALAKGNSKNTIVTGSGDEYTYSSNWTALCRKEGNTWKVIRVHCSIDPFRNPMVMAASKKIAMWIGIGCLAVGILVGWLIKRVCGRKYTT